MEIGGILMKKLIAFLLGVLLLVPGQTTSAAGAATNLSMLCDSVPRSVFSSPFSAWVLVKDSTGNVVPNQAVTLSVSGPATLEMPQGSQSNAQGYVNYNVIPNIGAMPQDIVVTAAVPGTQINLSCRTKFVNPSNFNTRVTLNAPDRITPGKTLTFTLKAVNASGMVIPWLPVTMQVTGLGFVGSLPKQLNANGEASADVLLGSADRGTVTATATVNVGSFLYTVTKTVLVELEPVVLPVSVEIYSSEQKVLVVVRNAPGGDVSVKIGSKWFRFRANSDVHVFEEPATDTSHQVTAWVNGSLENITTVFFPDYRKPTATPKPTSTPSSNPGASAPSRTITCKSGTKILTVTGSSPSCPKGFTRSGAPMPAGAKVVVCKKPGFVIRMAKPMTTCPAGYKK
jgi:hypothetical protein